MAMNRPNELAVTLVECISKLTQKELSDEINRIQKDIEMKNSSIFWRIYSSFPAILTSTPIPVDQPNLSAKPSLEIALDVFKESECKENSVNAQLLRELIRKSQGAEAESKLPHDEIVALNQLVLDKIRDTLKQNEEIKNVNSKGILSELKKTSEKKVTVKQEKPEEIKSDKSELIKHLKLHGVDIQPLPKKQSPINYKEKQYPASSKLWKEKPNTRSNAEVKQPASTSQFKR